MADQWKDEEIARFLARYQELVKDAERYRWLSGRDTPTDGLPFVCIHRHGSFSALNGALMDTMVDDARGSPSSGD